MGINNETIEIRISINGNITISIINWKYRDNDNIDITIKNVYFSSGDELTFSEFNFLKEIKKYSFIEYQNHFNQIGNNLIKNNINKDIKNKIILNSELKPNYTHNKIILFIDSISFQSLNNNHNQHNNIKKVNIISIMFGKERLIGEDEEEPLINNNNNYENINISTPDLGSLTDKSINTTTSPTTSTTKLSLFLFLNVSLSVLSTLQFGYNTGVISPNILSIQEQFSLDTNKQSMLVSSVLFGAMAGSFASGFVVDIFGRKKTLLANNLFYLLGPLLCAVGVNYATLLIGRLITGFGVGIASSVVPLYITEISPPSLRGALGLLRQSTVTLGIMLSSLVAYGLKVYPTGWRYTFAIAAVPSFAQFILAYWFVETPRWLISKGRNQEAYDIIKQIEPTITEEQIEQQVSVIHQSVLQQKGNDSWGQLFQLQFIKIYVIGFGLNMLQQFVGINCVIYFSGIILESAGFVKHTAVLISALVGIPQLIMLLISVWLIDRFGRKPLLLYGLVGMIIGLGVLGYPFYDNPNPSGAKGWTAVAGMVFFKLMFSMGLGPIPTIIASEIFPSKIRGKAMAISQLLNWAANCIVNSIYLHMVHSPLGQAGTFWVFGGISFITFFFVLFLVPETKGVTIEELSKKLLYKKGN